MKARFTPPRGLLLDFGSVVTVSLFEQHARTEERLGLAPGSLQWLGPIDPATDALWAAMQRDEISERDYWARRAAELGRLAGAGETWDMRALMRRVRNDDGDQVVRPEAQRLVQAAHAAGLRLGVLSNELELFYGERVRERFGVLGLMDCIVDLSHAGLLKPSPEAFARALSELGLPAREVLFVDDQFRNIAGAQACGLQVQWMDLRDPAGVFAAIAARLRLAWPQQEISE